MSLIRASRSRLSVFFGRDFGNFLDPAPRQAPSFYDSEHGPEASHDNDYSTFQCIVILPTADEVLATGKPVYMPKRDLKEPNPIPPGVDRLFDVTFRQLRFENVEIIRDVCYSAAQNAFLRPTTQPTSLHSSKRQGGPIPTLTNDAIGHLEPRHETPVGNRYFLYHNVQVEELLSHESKSVVVRLSYNCPPFMRGRKIHHTGRFEEGMLVALLCLDTSKNELDIHYLQVYMSQSTESMNGRGGQGRKAAVQVSFLPDTPKSVILQFANFAQKLCPEVEMCLVEFPKLLHAGFYNCLDRLQKLHNFAFSELIAPAMLPHAINDNICNRLMLRQPSMQQCLPPRYAEQPGFEYHLQPITKQGTAVGVSTYTLGELADPSSVAMIQSMTTLDRGQAAALRHSMRSQLAFTQGPPGTGKSFIGIALTRVLLASRPAASRKPILVVCLTNHALDSFLGGLKDAGVERLLRLGGGSKQEWTDSINLREKRRKTRSSAKEMSQLTEVKKRANDLFVDIDSWCQGQSLQELTGEVKWFAIETVLFNHHRAVYDQFVSAASAPMFRGLLFDFWLHGGDMSNVFELRDAIKQRLPKKRSAENQSDDDDDVEKIMSEMTGTFAEHEVLVGNSSIWAIPATERQTLVQEWAGQVDTSALTNDLSRLYGDHQSEREKLRSIQNARDIRIMQQADVIGMTTTACAGKWDLLNALDLKIVLCEEAGEVLEPHVICSLLPTVQHAIFIGDPQQLRPEVSELVLSLDCTSDYRLDESLFEKMILPRDPALKALPMAQLNIQRRMHPSISALSRLTYPFLQDHESTVQHPPTIGLVHRVFWWDHRVPELEETGVTKSHVNQHEVDMVVGLVQYLLKGSAYSQGDIAVLTPYSGQLARLHECLKTTCKIWLNDRDREMLLSQELLEDDGGPRTRDDVSVLDMLRVATVDNFQGEEAEIVILTTVRSGGRPGFLSIPNRINVACSRARNGFYIIGNSETLRQVDMWNDILSILGYRRGFELMTHCTNHPNHFYGVRHPKDFDSIPACPIPCDASLACDHPCPETCHPLELHDEDIIPCVEQCEKLLRCGHRCTKRCGVECGNCQTEMSDILLECGHAGFLLCSGKASKCGVSLGQKMLLCGHLVEAICGDSDKAQVCKEACFAKLACGHGCPGVCGQCAENGHAKCSFYCGKRLKCGHFCHEGCGHDGECPPCEKMVRVACEHGTRTKLCTQPTELCLKSQSSTIYPVEDGETPCCLPSTILPPNDPCDKLLPCGHLCSSLKSELCIPAYLCAICDACDRLEKHLYLPECGHVVEIESLDNCNLQGIYATDMRCNIVGFGDRLASIDPPQCNVCGIRCPSVGRYSQVLKFAEFHTNVDTFLGQVYTQLDGYSSAVEALEQRLAANLELFKNEIRSGPMAANSNKRLLIIRKDTSRDLMDKIYSYRVGVVEPFEKHVAKLAQSCSFIPKYRFVVGLHLQTIQTRCLIIALLDQVKVGQYLLAVNDPSSITPNMGTQVLRAAAAEAITTYLHTGDLISAATDLATSPALNVEARLQQVMGWMLADLALRTCKSVSFAHHAPIIAFPRFRLSLDVAVDVAKHYPEAGKPFLDTAYALRGVLDSVQRGEYPVSLPKVDYSGARNAEKQFRGYSRAVGSGVSACEVGHPYFKAVSGEEKGCPVCGKEVALSDEEFVAAGRFLREEEFLAKMRKL